MPIEPPDPLNIAKVLRDIREQTDVQRLRIATLVNAFPEKAEYRAAYANVSAAMLSDAAAANDLDPPA